MKSSVFLDRFQLYKIITRQKSTLIMAKLFILCQLNGAKQLYLVVNAL
jgi:hypothetical protein